MSLTEPRASGWSSLVLKVIYKNRKATHRFVLQTLGSVEAAQKQAETSAPESRPKDAPVAETRMWGALGDHDITTTWQGESPHVESGLSPQH